MEITKKIKAFQSKSGIVEKLNYTPVVETEGLKSHEIALLIILIERQIIDVEGFSIYSLRSEMNKAGYTDVATGVGVRVLEKKEFIITRMQGDGNLNGDYYPAAFLTEKGKDWVLSNQDQLVFRKPPKESKEDDLPF